MADFEVYSQKGLNFEKVADTKRLEDGEKVLENQPAGYIVRDGHAVVHKNVKPLDIDNRLRREAWQKEEQ